MAGIEKALNIGPICSAELSSIGIDTVEKLQDLGWEEVFLRWIEAYPERINLNAATGLIGAEEEIDWRSVTPLKKAKARALVERLRKLQGGSSTRRSRK